MNARRNSTRVERNIITNTSRFRFDADALCSHRAPRPQRAVSIGWQNRSACDAGHTFGDLGVSVGIVHELTSTVPGIVRRSARREPEGHLMRAVGTRVTSL